MGRAYALPKHHKEKDLTMNTLLNLNSLNIPEPMEEQPFEYLERKENTSLFLVEMTDTFGGDLNFCWRESRRVEVPKDASNRSITIAAKKALGISGVKAYKKWDCGDEVRYDISGACVAFTITYIDEEQDRHYQEFGYYN